MEEDKNIVSSSAATVAHSIATLHRSVMGANE